MVPRLDAPPAGPTAVALSLRAFPATPVPDPTPLTPDHLRVLADARARARKVLRAASVASFSGWSMVLFAVVTILFSLTDIAGLALGVGMAAAAYNELRGAALLRRFDVRGPSRLAVGQLAFGALIVGYAAWRLLLATRAGAAPGSSDPQVDELLAQMNMDGLMRTLTVAIYAAVALVGIVVPGLTALYYRSRAPLVRRFVSETPAWAVQALQV